MGKCTCIEVEVKNDLQKYQCERTGIYKISEAGNRNPTWVDETNKQAIWWITHLNVWGIGDLNSLGTDVRGITGKNDEIDNDDEFEFGVPFDPKFTWYYWNRNLQSFEKVPETDDFIIKCSTKCDPNDKASFLFKLYICVYFSNHLGIKLNKSAIIFQ